jgi:hypothetical protein
MQLPPPLIGVLDTVPRENGGYAAASVYGLLLLLFFSSLLFFLFSPFVHPPRLRDTPADAILVISITANRSWC